MRGAAARGAAGAGASPACLQAASPPARASSRPLSSPTASASGISASGWSLLALSWCLLLAGADARAVTAATRLVSLDTPSEAGVQGALMLAAYLLQYLVLGGLFESSHPAGALRQADAALRARRARQVRSEVCTGLLSLAVTVALAVGYMALLEPRTPYYGYFETRAWSWAWGLGGTLAYVAAFDTHFYWSHYVLHRSEWLWQHIHFQHHQYKEPSAFAQFAVHPVEAALQGPFGHFFVQLFFPVHPVHLAILGFLSSAYAFAAHDGRALALTNYHYYHHSKGRGRMTYFNLGFLTPVWDVLCGTRWYPEHPLWLEWEAKKGKILADTRDGKAGGIKNDAFDAYAKTQ